jgi:hypothetical protein
MLLKPGKVAMSQRLIVGLEAGADWARIKSVLVQQGADWTRDPSDAQPDVLLASIPEERGIDAVIGEIEKLPGVRYVERDAMRWTM